MLALSAPTVEAVTRMAVECIEGVDGSGPAGPFAVPAIAAERRPAALELAVDMSQLWGELERVEAPEAGFERQLFDAASSMAWMYASVAFGEGDELDWEFVLPYGSETLLGRFIGFFGEADRSLLRAVPAGATGAIVGSFDLDGFVRWTLALVREIEPDLGDRIDDALVAAGETADGDVMEDVLGNLKGDFLSFSSPRTDVTTTLAPLAMEPLTLVVGVEDADPLIDIVDSLMDLTGLGARATSSTAPVADSDEEIELWRVDTGVGLEVIVGAGAGRFAVSTDAVGFDGYLTRTEGDGSTGSFLDDPAIAAAAGRARGALVSVQSMDAAADSLLSSMRTIESALQALPGGDDATEGVREVIEAMDRIALLMKQYIQGVVLSELRIEDDRIRYRTTTR